jgi:RNA polymerase sigma factor (TIGR02999 family)
MPQDLTHLLQAASAGDTAAQEKLYAAAYAELHALATQRLQGSSGPLTLLNPTSLVHETVLRVLGAPTQQFPSSQHFLAYAARAMRSVVVDLIRQRQTLRHGAGAVHLTLDTAADAADIVAADQALRVHEALHELAQLEPRLATVVELRYFGGLEDTEIAQALDLTVRTVQRDWTKARLYLSEALR